MTRWRALPDDLEPEVADLIRELRGLKDVTELTLMALASKTAYSKSAWERYFNGKKLPPRQAVKALAEIAGPEHVVPLLALWQRAAQTETRGRPQEGDGGEAAEDERRTEAASATLGTAGEGSSSVKVDSGDDGDVDSDEGALPGRRRVRLRVLVGVCAATALLVGVALVLAVVLHPDGGRGAGKDARATASPSPVADDRSASPAGCRKETCEGKDPRLTGCGQDARTVASVWLSSTLIELRYSSRCQAAWGRILAAEVGDQVHVDTVDGRAQTGHVKFGVDAFSPMAPVADPSGARACATLTNKAATCTPQGSDALADPASSSGG
ncbi:DUF2690 domain-containing protein [Streptomyces humidus]|nr:DUF2690 domain-containing protein [Streptomyces humidus]